MTEQSCNVDIETSESNTINVTIGFGNCRTTESIPILCPNDKEGESKHIISKNGRDTSVKESPQQYYCQTCFRSFYAHTSKAFRDLEKRFKQEIFQALKGGAIRIDTIADRLRQNNTSVSRLLSDIVRKTANDLNGINSFLNKRRKSNALFLDETFITIHKKTWYLIIAVSGNNHVMALQLVEKRDFETILKIVRDCQNRLCSPLEILITDGFPVYQAVAEAIGRNIIHIQHIHKPPYGRIEIDIYSYKRKDLTITTVKTTNEITRVGGYFLARVTDKRKSFKGGKKRGRKPGTPNRSKNVIRNERKQKELEKKKRGRPPGVKRPTSESEIHAFFHDKLRGRVKAAKGSSELVAAMFGTVFKQFRNVSITTNLVEKEFSALKKLLCFRGRRDAELWLDLLTAYYEIRENPQILKNVLDSIRISPKMVKLALSNLLSVKISK